MPDERIMISGDVLRDQYADDGRLRARQSLWQLRPGPSLYETVLDLAALDGTETIVDVGCGNGAYLAELRRRGHAGTVLGLDRSAAMAREAGSRTVVADAQDLPLSDGRADVAFSLHMLYHVPDIDRAVAELRRVVRPGGRVVVTTNGPGHTAEIKAVLARAAADVTGYTVDRRWDVRRFTPEVARLRLAAVFDVVAEHPLGDTFPAPGEAVVGCVASWPPEVAGLAAGETWDAILARVGELVAAHVEAHGAFAVTSDVSVLIAR